MISGILGFLVLFSVFTFVHKVFFLKINIYFYFTNALPTVCMYTMCIPGTCGAEESDRCSGTGVTDGCKLPCMHWEPNPGPLLLNKKPSF